jgi:hypothetical protein
MTTSKTEDGGPAFPSPSFRDPDGFKVADAQHGMSLRDYFAGQALIGLIASNDEGAGDRLDEVPAYAYQIADAMLAARSTGGQS